MAEARKLAVRKPPHGIVWIEDYEDEEGVIPGIASRLGISPSTYRKWRMRDEGPVSFYIGKKVAARIDSIEAWLAGLEEAAVEAGRVSGAAAAYAIRPAEARVTPSPRRAAGQVGERVESEPGV